MPMPRAISPPAKVVTPYAVFPPIIIPTPPPMPAAPAAIAPKGAKHRAIVIPTIVIIRPNSGIAKIMQSRTNAQE